MTRQATIATRESLLNSFADALAESGSVADAAHQVGATRAYGRTMFKRIRKRLGWQAS